MESIDRKTHVIDAKLQHVGRLAVRVALLLRGKQKPEFAGHKDVGDFVSVKNVRHMTFSGKKLRQKSYKRHSGYLGSLRETTLENFFGSRPSEVLRKAVWGMLPKNKLRTRHINRLTIE